MIAPTMHRWKHLVALVAFLLALAVAGAFMLATGANAATAAQQLAARGLNCTQTDKPNGGFVLDCDPPGGTPSPSTSASASPSSTPMASPSGTPSSSSSSPAPSASTSPSSTSGPTVSPSGPLTNCQLRPGACGFPDAESTGATSAASGTVLTGNRTFSVAGQVVANTTINGCVEVRAAGVTFRNVVFNAGGCFWGVRNFSTGLQVVDSTLTCAGTNGTGFGSSDLSLLRVEITRCENGLNVAGRVSVVDSWIHDMNGGQGGAHTDGAQLNQGAADVVFRHNTINVGPANGATSAIISWNEGNPQNRNVAIDANLLAGGTFTIYCPRQPGATNFRVTNNRFGTYEYGPAESCSPGHVTEWSGNVRDATGQALAAA